MAKVVQLRGQTPGGWSKERWAWIKAVAADGRLLPMARLVATVLAQGYANHETAECRPGLAALSKAVAAHKRTVLRALADLQEAGWIERAGGNAPGREATYRFRTPQQVTAAPPEQVTRMTPRQVTAQSPEQVTPVTRTGDTEEIPPTPPYKDKPNMNQMARGNRWPRSATKVTVAGGVRPTPFSRTVQIGTEPEADWNAWLVLHGFPELAVIGRRVQEGMLDGWDMPWMRPPSATDQDYTSIALRFAEWLRAKA